MALVNQCETYEIVATAGLDASSTGKHEWIQYPMKGYNVCDQIKETRDRIGKGGIFTRQCLEWCKEQFKGQDFERIIVFSDSQDCDRKHTAKPTPFGKNNYIIDVSAHTKGINYKGVWTAEISGWSTHFISYIRSLEGMSNDIQE